jgi:hypothetical protein
VAKQEVLQQVDDAYTDLEQSLRQVNESAAGKQWYGEWNLKQILAHLIGWDEEMKGALERVARGERPTPEGVDYSDADAWNAQFADQFASGSWDDVMQRLDGAHSEFRSALAAVADESRFEEGKTAYRIAHNAVIEHYKEHAEAIRAWPNS